MIVAHLELMAFRNYEHASVALDPGVTVLLGSNGQGKTNLVEAIGYLAAGASHRVAGDQALIMDGRDQAIVRARLRHGERSITIEAELNRGAANRILVNKQPVRGKEARRHLDSVIFAPEDLALVRDEPAGRRRFLDGLLVMRQPRLAGVLADYERVLRQRNSLLKSARNARLTEATLSTLEVWDAQLADHGARLVAARAALVAALAPHVARGYATIAGDEHAVALAMEETAGATADAFLAALAEGRADELDRGLTLVGPHRDDLLIELNAMPARTHASHGESWSTALALKLGAAALLRETGPAGDPVIVLDDVFAELDARRRGRLVAAVTDYEQVLITAAVAEDVPRGIVGPVLHVRAGAIVEDAEELADGLPEGSGDA